MNDSANTNLFTVGKTGDTAAKGSLTGTSLLSTGSLGLQVKNGVSTVASINQAGAIVGTSCQINGRDVLISTYKPFYCAGRVNADGTKAADTGRVPSHRRDAVLGFIGLPTQQPTQTRTL